MTRPSTALDGNAAAGAFLDVFGTDVTTVVVTCACCRAAGPFAALAVFLSDLGAVVRCPGCDHLLARVVQTPTERWVELSGSASWRFPLGEPATDDGVRH
jgi:hypothetical protein